jgi:enoyl-CoA hydratase/carnithine racemase
VTVALIQGAAYGAGADLAAACRYRIGLPDCRFKFPGSRFGVVLGTSHLAHLVGVRNAQDIILRNQLLPSNRALELGLLDAVVQDKSAFLAWLERLENDLADLDTATLQQLLTLLVPDTRSRDSQALLQSVKHPGLHERIAHYRAAASKQKSSD